MQYSFSAPLAIEPKNVFEIIFTESASRYCGLPGAHRNYCLTRRRLNFWNVWIIFALNLVFFWFFGSVLVNQPTAHSGGVSMGRV